MEKTSLRSSRWFSFLFCQFLGAANDNAYKVTLVALAGLTLTAQGSFVTFNAIAGSFIPIAFLLFSPFAGYISDRIPKSRMIFFAKFPELLAMLIAIFALGAGNLNFAMIVFFFMATQSAFFSPAKYGIIPEVFEEKELSTANGILEGTTNISILLGSVAGTVIFNIFRDNLTNVGLVYFAVAVLGTIAALYVPKAPPGNKDAKFMWNLFASMPKDWALVKPNRALKYGLFGIAYFNFLGALFLILVPVLGRDNLGVQPGWETILMAFLTIGIAIGSVTAGKISRGKVELGLVPIGSLGLTLFALDMSLFGMGGSRIVFNIPLRAAIDLILLGFSAGFFIVPLRALVQQQSPSGMKGRITAFLNLLSFIGVLLASGFSFGMSRYAGMEVQTVIVIAAGLTFFSTAFVFRLLPDFFVRLVLFLLTHTFYRVKSTGLQNIPKRGCLLVANHVTWVDPLLIGAATDRMVHFLMYRGFYESPLVHWFFKRVPVIPVSGKDTPEQKEASLAEARKRIEQGHVVCIFAEGMISRVGGHLLKFRRGLERIAGELPDCPIVPVFMDGLWGSIFSYSGGKFLFKWPKKVPYPVEILFGKPMDGKSKSHEVRAEMQALAAETYRERLSDEPSIQKSFYKIAKKNWRRPFILEKNGIERTFGQTLVRSLELRRRLWEEKTSGSIDDGEKVGILLPPGEAAVLANLACLFAGKIPVNLDEKPLDVLSLETKRAGIVRVLSSGKYLEQNSSLNPSLGQVALWDLDVEMGSLSVGAVGRLSLWSALRGLSMSEMDGVASILFSMEHPDSPKPVLLSQRNVHASVKSLTQVFEPNREDVILCSQPFSTSVGLVCNFWLAALSGCAIAFAGEKEDAKGLPITLLSGLSGYLSQYRQSDFPDLRAVYVGGEVTEDFESRFEVPIYKGYGCLECTAVIAINTDNFESKGMLQEGSKRGTRGRPIPGISLRIANPETFEILPPNEKGLLLVSGPTVMAGYFNDDQATSEVIRGGWFHTGESAHLDDDGFLWLSNDATT